MASFTGDEKLNFWEKLQWLLINFWGGILNYHNGRKFKFWRPEILDTDSESPYRKIINAFLKKKIPELLKGNEVSVLDIGCGTGYVYKLITGIGYRVDYTGVDLIKRSAFERNVPGGRLVLSKIEDFSPDRKFDLVISNTCLEHIRDDVLSARKMLGFGGAQIHIVPSFWSLPLYLWHGYRQYGPRSVRLLFGEKGEAFRLGGVFSFLLHFFLITVPQRVLRHPFIFRKYNWYSSLCRIANTLDTLAPCMSAMYIVVIRENRPKE